TAAEKSVLRFRAPAPRARPDSCRETSPCAPPLQFLRPADKFGPDRQLMRREFHRFRGRCQIHTGHLKHHAARFDNGYPLLRWSFALTHTSLSRLLGERLIGEYANPK